MRRTTRRRRKNSKSNRKGDPTSPKSKRRYTRRKVKRHSPRRATTPPFKLNPSAPKKRKYAKRLGKTKMKGGGIFDDFFKNKNNDNKNTDIVDTLVDGFSKLTAEQIKEFIKKIPPELRELLLAHLNESTGTVPKETVNVADAPNAVGDAPNAVGDAPNAVGDASVASVDTSDDASVDKKSESGDAPDSVDPTTEDDYTVSVESVVETNQKEEDGTKRDDR